MRTFFKTPAAVLPWVFDWSSWLDTGEVIVTSTVTAAGGITLGDGTNGAAAASHDDTTTTFWLLGGTDGAKYEVTNTVTTSAGRTDERTVLIWISVR